jgi:hypothetical protein
MNAPAGFTAHPVNERDSLPGEGVGPYILPAVILWLTAVTALIHVQLGGTLFLLNGLGYGVLGTAYAIAVLVPLPLVQRLAWLPRLAAPGTDSIALGYATDLGGVRLGLLGTVPAAQATHERTLEASSFGSRRALGLVAQQRLAGTTYGVMMAFADHFERPIGIATSGAFGIDDSGAVSSGMFVQRSVGANTVLEASLEVARHRTEASAALSAPAYAVRSAGFGARTLLGPKTTLSAGVKREWTGGEAARLNVPLTIDENGDIGRMTYALPYDDLVGRTSFSLRLDHRLAPQVDLRASVTRERYGFGASASGIAAVLEIAN